VVRAIAVVESTREATLLSRALLRVHRDRGPDPEVLAGGSISGALSLARSLLLEPDNRVALVLDADSVDGEDLAERRRFLSSTLDDVRSSGWEIFLVADLTKRLSDHDGKASRTLETLEAFLWPPKSARQTHQRLEAQMIEAIASWLGDQGWKFQVPGGRGVDAIARRDGEVLRIEFKAAPSMSDTPNRAGTSGVYALGQAIYRTMTWLAGRGGLVAIVVSDTPTFRRAIEDVEGPLRLLGVGVFLVATDGSVVEHIPLATGQSA
jgi:hypothetical protein